MSKQRIILTPASDDLITFTILLDGQTINSIYQILSVKVFKEVNKIPTAKITILDGDASKEDFEVSNTEDFIPGKEIEILAGYHSEESPIFKGIIIKHGIKVKDGNPSVLIIDCKDKAITMTVGRQSAYFYESSDSDVIEEMLGKYDLKKNIEATDVVHKELVQYYSTDWDFMLCRTDVNCKLVFVDDGKVSINKPDITQEPKLSLIYGATILEFEAEMDARDQYSAVCSSSWDSSTQEIIESEGEAPELPKLGNVNTENLSDVMGIGTLNLHHSGQIKDQELQAWADSKLLKSRLAKIRGRIKFQGFADIKPGNIIELKGLGDRFNGNAFVSAISHEIAEGNWITNAQIGLSEEWFSSGNDIIETFASGLLPAVSGLQIGIVTRLQDDPDGEDRILVKMPMIDNRQDGIWARVAIPDAGNKRAVFFRPEIGDEVVLGFLNNEPRNPIVLGSLNSSAKPAPIPASDENHEKGIITRSELKLIFNDEKNNIEVSSPNGNKIVLSEDEGSLIIIDENDNKIEMTADGINMESSGDINIKAKGDITIEGTNIFQKAGAQFKAEGGSGAELSTDAVAVVKGSLVQIN